jgi:hypothetical protein
MHLVLFLMFSFSGLCLELWKGSLWQQRMRWRSSLPYVLQCYIYISFLQLHSISLISVCLSPFLICLAVGMEYIMDAGGIDTEEFYPYLMQDSYCRFSKDHIATSITGYGNVTVGDEAALADAVSTYGPISVAIDVTESMVFYGSGVYYEPACKSDFADLNHGVLVVGYGSNTAGQDYWIVKNSWSTYWGDEGYILMARNKGNNCGIATAAVYALIE